MTWSKWNCHSWCSSMTTSHLFLIEAPGSDCCLVCKQQATIQLSRWPVLYPRGGNATSRDQTAISSNSLSMSGLLCHLVHSLQTVCYSTEDTLYLYLKPRVASCIHCLLGLTLGQVYNLSRLQLTRQRFELNCKVGVPWTRCQPWWALQVIKRWIGCRSAVCIVTGSGKRTRGWCWSFSL